MYIDGFNLYFGCLKRARHCRWLDIAALAQLLCHENNPSSEIVGVKYFTARIKTVLSPRGAEACKAQNTYLRAIQAHTPSLQVIEGKYFIVPGWYYGDSKPVDFSKKYRVLRHEEKHTDVNITLHMLSDATDELCDQQVLFSNNSDCAPILEMIQQRHPSMTLGVVPPILNSDKGLYPSRELTDFATCSRKPINEEILQSCQLPNPVRTRKRALDRPVHWK